MWLLIGVDVQSTILKYRLPNQYLGVFWPTLCPMHVYKPHISTPWASFAPVAFGEREKSLGVRNTNTFFVRKSGSNIEFRKIFIHNQNFQVRNTSMFQKSNFHSLYHFSLQLKTHFFELENFFFIKLSMTSANPSWLALAFFIKTHETNFILDWNIFLHDLTWKFQFVNSCFKFDIFGQNFSSAHEIDCLVYMTSLLVLASNHLRF